MNKYFKPKGLANFTGNCYMNSLLQCLYYCIEFRDKIIDVDFDEENSMVVLLKELFKEFKTSQKSVIYPSKIKQKLKENELFKNGEGSDATDLLDFIFNSIYYELKPENSFTETVNYESKIYDKNAMLEEAKEDIMTKTILDEIFLGIYEKDSKCLNGHHKYSFQIEYKIVFSLEKISELLNKNDFDLYDCFKYNYIYKEKTKYKCYNNYCYKNMNSYEKIFENPKILVIILDRGYNKEYDKKVHFDFEIDISEYMDEKEKNKNSNTYQLIGISIHKGTTGKYGHYVAICLCDDNKYYYFNDSSFSEVNNSYMTQIIQYSSPYILFYRRVEKEKNKFKFKNKRFEIHAKGHKETIIEQTSKYLKNYEFNQRSSDEYQWKGEKNRKVISKFFGDGVEFYFEAPILKVKCCNSSTHRNKTFFTIKFNDLKYNSFIDIFNEKFSSFFHEI